MYKAVIFDMDGVLADTEYFYQNRRERYLQENGWPFTPGMDFTGSNEKIMWETLVPDDPAKREEMKLGYREYQRRHPVPFDKLTDPQVKPLMTELNRRGVRVAIASSSALPVIGEMMEIAGITTLVDIAVSGEDCQNPKPAPDVYVVALNKLGVKPEDAVAVEDSPIGIDAAKAAGLCTYALLPRHGENLDQSAADGVIAQLTDLLTLI